LDTFAARLAEAGIALHLSASDSARFAKLHPLGGGELEHAIAAAVERRANRAAYVLGVIESERKRAADVPLMPSANARRTRPANIGPHPGSDPDSFGEGDQRI
jgi:hypothetical protein